MVDDITPSKRFNLAKMLINYVALIIVAYMIAGVILAWTNVPDGGILSQVSNWIKMMLEGLGVIVGYYFLDTNSTKISDVLSQVKSAVPAARPPGPTSEEARARLMTNGVMSREETP